MNDFNKRMMVVLVSTAAFIAAPPVLADQWPEAKAAEYFNSCVAIHNQRWQGMPDATISRLCNCKLGTLRRFDYTAFSKAKVTSEGLEKYLALSDKYQDELFDGADDNTKSAMFLVGMAEQECAPK